MAFHWYGKEYRLSCIELLREHQRLYLVSKPNRPSLKWCSISAAVAGYKNVDVSSKPIMNETTRFKWQSAWYSVWYAVGQRVTTRLFHSSFIFPVQTNKWQRTIRTLCSVVQTCESARIRIPSVSPLCIRQCPNPCNRWTIYLVLLPNGCK